MFQIDALQSQWLALSLLGGAIVAAAMTLTFVSMWRPRTSADLPAPAGRPTRGWFLSFMPWVLMLLYIGCVLYTAAYTIAYAMYPPNV